MKEIKVYTTKECPYCVKAKEFLKTHNLPYKEIVVDKITGENLESFRKDCPGEKTVPQILVNNRLIEGGYSGLICSGIED